MKPLLLDINVLIALLDPVHIHHISTHEWFSGQTGTRWASCPITQNGYVRIVSQSSYPNPLATGAAVSLLQDLTARPDHRFWPDSLSLLDGDAFVHDRLRSNRQITDTYLLALAKANGGMLATLDAKLNTAAVEDGRKHLLILPNAG